MFGKIIGNEHVKSILEKMLKKQIVPNTILFQGLDGVGKSLFARDFAKMLILGDDMKGENKIDHNSHPDFHEYLLEDSNTHSIQSMRQMIEEIHKPPYEGRAKVFIIHDADKMLDASANAILKTLEEPNLDSYIILLSSSPNELLTTIQSRCFKLRFNAIEVNEIVKYLVNTCNKSDGVANYIAKMSTGSVGKAHLLASNLDVETVIEKILDLLKNQYMPSIELIEDFCKSFDVLSIKIELIFSIFLMWFRDQIVCSFDANTKHLYFKDDLPEKPKIMSLEIIHYFLEKAKKGIDRNLKTSNCLHNFFLEVYSRSY
jgi:DNA polymerase III subunit delta'